MNRQRCLPHTLEGLVASVPGSLSALLWGGQEVALALAAVKINSAGLSCGAGIGKEKGCVLCRSTTVLGANSVPGAARGI